MLFFRNDRVTVQEREKIILESEVSEEKAKKIADDRKRTAARVSFVFRCLSIHEPRGRPQGSERLCSSNSLQIRLYFVIHKQG